jgi:osmoprotectant transport system ATP-binding protein
MISARQPLARSADPPRNTHAPAPTSSAFERAPFPGIGIRDLQKHYDGAFTLDIPSLDVEPHTTLALIGPSGCGKSTLLRSIVGLVLPDRGAIEVGGVLLAPATRRGIRLSLGYVIQEGGLFPHLTAGENVALVARDVGWSDARVAERIEALLELTRLPSSLLARYPAEVSGGQRQRLALMRALMLDPGVLLLDEPLGALDPMIRADLQRELADTFERLRKTVLIVTHDVGEAAFLADEIAVMKAGRLVQRGTFEALERTPAEPFVTEFLNAQRAPGVRRRESR